MVTVELPSSTSKLPVPNWMETVKIRLSLEGTLVALKNLQFLNETLEAFRGIPCTMQNVSQTMYRYPEAGNNCFPETNTLDCSAKSSESISEVEDMEKEEKEEKGKIIMFTRTNTGVSFINYASLRLKIKGSLYFLFYPKYIRNIYVSSILTTFDMTCLMLSAKKIKLTPIHDIQSLNLFFFLVILNCTETKKLPFLLFFKIYTAIIKL